MQKNYEEIESKTGKTVKQWRDECKLRRMDCAGEECLTCGWNYTVEKRRLKNVRENKCANCIWNK